MQNRTMGDQERFSGPPSRNCEALQTELDRISDPIHCKEGTPYQKYICTWLGLAFKSLSGKGYDEHDTETWSTITCTHGILDSPV